MPDSITIVSETPWWQAWLPFLSGLGAASIIGFFTLRATREANDARREELSDQLKADRQRQTDESVRRDQELRRRHELEEWVRQKSDVAQMLSEWTDLRYEVLQAIFLPSDERRRRVVETMTKARRLALLYSLEMMRPGSTATSREVIASGEMLVKSVEDAGDNSTDADVRAKLVKKLTEFKDKSEQWFSEVFEEIEERRPEGF